MKLLPTLAVAVAAGQLASASLFGVGYAADNTWAKHLTKFGQLKWYHHWENGRIPELDQGGSEFVPTYWGAAKEDDWNKVKADFDAHPPQWVLNINEPDVPSQGNTSPEDAVTAHFEKLVPLQKKFGTKIISPQLCWDLDWMDKFMTALQKRGGKVDAIAVHSYDSWQQADKLKKFIQTVHQRWPDQQIWVTEFGITTKSHPSPQQAQDYMESVTRWLEGTGYVSRVAWFGAFAVDNPPDGFASGQNALFDGSGQLRPMGEYWAKGGRNSLQRRLDSTQTHAAAAAPAHERMRRHHAQSLRMRGAGQVSQQFHDDAEPREQVQPPPIAQVGAEVAALPEAPEQGETVHCDARCHARDELVDRFSKLGPHGSD